jgi:hypothetical protein
MYKSFLGWVRGGSFCKNSLPGIVRHFLPAGPTIRRVLKSRPEYPNTALRLASPVTWECTVQGATPCPTAIT